MRRDTALALLVTEQCTQANAIRQAARILGCSTRSIADWPREGHLPQHTADRVLATVARRRLSAWVAHRLAKGKPVSPVELDAIAVGDNPGVTRNAPVTGSVTPEVTQIP